MSDKNIESKTLGYLGKGQTILNEENNGGKVRYAY